jgi:hypothetical protein
MENQEFCREYLNTIENLKVTIFWIVMSYSLIKVHWYVGGTYCFQLQVRKISKGSCNCRENFTVNSINSTCIKAKQRCKIPENNFWSTRKKPVGRSCLCQMVTCNKRELTYGSQDSKGFWPWCMTLRLTGSLDVVYPPSPEDRNRSSFRNVVFLSL